MIQERIVSFTFDPYHFQEHRFDRLLHHYQIVKMWAGWTERGYILYWVPTLSFSCQKLFSFSSNSCNIVWNFVQVVLIDLFLQVLFTVFLRFWVLSILLRFSQRSSLNTVESIISSHHNSPYHSTTVITWTSPTLDLFRRSCICCVDLSATITSPFVFLVLLEKYRILLRKLFDESYPSCQ